MGVISKSEHVFRVYLNSKRINDKEALSYLKSSDKSVLIVDTAMQEVSELHWHEILENLDNDITELLDYTHTAIGKDESSENFSLEDWATIIQKNPEIILGIIIINDDDFIHFSNPKEVIQFIADSTDSTYQNRS